MSRSLELEDCVMPAVVLSAIILCMGQSGAHTSAQGADSRGEELRLAGCRIPLSEELPGLCVGECYISVSTGPLQLGSPYLLCSL